jgi:hypothetical protein
MKELLKKIGVIFIIVGVVVLGYSEFSGAESNKILVVSGGLIFGGFLLYVILNNILD